MRIVSFTAVVAIICSTLVGSYLRAGDKFPLGIDTAKKTLEDYVRKPDAAYGWKVRREGRVGATRYTELILTSQIWRDIPWKHQLFLLRPSRTPQENRHALLLIAGGSWRDRYEQPPADGETLPRDALLFARLAEILQTPIAVLLQVPRQPLFNGLHEDEIISYTFDQFVKTGDPSWPLLLPMVKSAVKAMDATTEFAKQNWEMKIDTFTVTGASKRGWTTWLTGAVDRRATAIAPMVIDVLNMKEHLDYQKRVWGEYSEQIGDYTEKGLPELMDSKPGEVLRAIVDPYSYRQRYRQPKLLLIGTNDRYWPVDALNLYWKDLPQPKYVLYIPNNGHGLKDIVRVMGTINALHQHAARGFTLPKLTWSVQKQNGGIDLRVESDKKPESVVAWVATSPTRDFREAKWRSFAMESSENGYRYHLPVPKEGYAAVFGEAVYRDLHAPYFLSTTLHVAGGASSSSATSSSESP